MTPSLTNYLRKLLGCSASARRTLKYGVRPRVELLEDRSVPSVATFTVNTNLDETVAGDGKTSLREAILAANTNGNPADVDLIKFDPSLAGKTIHLDAGMGELAISQSVNIQGPGASRLTVDGGADISDVFNINGGTRIFDVLGSQTLPTMVTISGLTFKHGGVNAGDGGAIATSNFGLNVEGDTLTLRSDVFSQNGAVGTPYHDGGGGAVALDGGHLIVQDSVFDGNKSAANGGAIAYLDSNHGTRTSDTVLLQRSTFTNNSAGSYGDGGAFFVGGPGGGDTGANTTIEQCTFKRNTADGDGGAVMLSNSIPNTTLTIRDSVFDRNSSSGTGAIEEHDYDGSLVVLVERCTISNNVGTIGGGLQVGGAANGTGSATISRCLFSGNTASYGGGAIDAFTVATVIENTTIVGNSAVGDGGGVDCGLTTLTFRNDTIARNKTTQGLGGGIFNYFGTVNIFNTILDTNTDQTGLNDISFRGDGPLFNVQNSLIHFGQPFVNGVNAHNIFDFSANLGPLQNNGGPTLTLKPMPGSKALRAGSIALLSADMKTDQRGFPRTFGSTVEIGAVEASQSTTFKLFGIVVTLLSHG